MKENSSSSNKTKVIIVAVLIGLGILVLIILLGFLFLQGGFGFLASATPTQVFPTLFVPTPDCGSPTLVIGSTTFQIQPLALAPDGVLTVPPDNSAVAYWVNGTNKNYVFVFSPTQDNISFMSTVTAGITAKATWKNCNSTTYTLSASQPGAFSSAALPDQSVDGITVFFPSDASGAGSVFTGELTEEQISTFNTPAVGTSDIQAEISLLETTTSADGTTIKVSVSIQNYGAAAFTLSTSDVSLTQQDGTSLNMVSSEPPLPKEIAPGATETIYFTFPRPASPTATLKIFTVEYDIEGY
jgi:hypothetical protein